MDMPTTFIRIIIFFDEDFKYGDGEKLWDYVGAITKPLYIIPKII
jgi:hypothetical protein